MEKSKLLEYLAEHLSKKLYDEAEKLLEDALAEAYDNGLHVDY